MFGELALIYHQRRLATVICMSETEMCTMDSVQFNKILGVLQRQEDQKKNEFIEKEILKDKEFSSLAHVIGVNFVKRVMPKNKVIFRQGDLPEKVYLIYSGQVKLVKETEIARDFDVCAKKKSVPSISALEISKPLQASDEQKPVRIEFALLGNGQMMGEEHLGRAFAAVFGIDQLVGFFRAIDVAERLIATRRIVAHAAELDRVFLILRLAGEQRGLVTGAGEGRSRKQASEQQ